VRFADEYNTIMPTLEEARDRCRILEEAASAAGRNRLTFSILAGCVVGADEGDFRRRLHAWRELTGRDGAPELAGTVEQVSERLRSYGSVGIDRVMLQHLVHEDVEMVALIGEVGKSLGGS